MKRREQVGMGGAIVLLMATSSHSNPLLFVSVAPGAPDFPSELARGCGPNW